MLWRGHVNDVVARVDRRRAAPHFPREDGGVELDCQSGDVSARSQRDPHAAHLSFQNRDARSRSVLSARLSRRAGFPRHILVDRVCAPQSAAQLVAASEVELSADAGVQGLALGEARAGLVVSLLHHQRARFAEEALRAVRLPSVNGRGGEEPGDHDERAARRCDAASASDRAGVIGRSRPRASAGGHVAAAGFAVVISIGARGTVRYRDAQCIAGAIEGFRGGPSGAGPPPPTDIAARGVASRNETSHETNATECNDPMRHSGHRETVAPALFPRGHDHRPALLPVDPITPGKDRREPRVRPECLVRHHLAHEGRVTPKQMFFRRSDVEQHCRDERVRSAQREALADEIRTGGDSLCQDAERAADRVARRCRSAYSECPYLAAR